MKQLRIILSLVLLTSLHAKAKVRVIDIKKALEEAKQIRTIIITGYNDSVMFYRLINSNAIL